MLRITLQRTSTRDAVTEAVAEERQRIARLVQRNWWDGQEPMSAALNRLGNVLDAELGGEIRE